MSRSLQQKIDSMLKSKPIKEKLDEAAKEGWKKGNRYVNNRIYDEVEVLNKIVDEFIDTVQYHMNTEIVGDETVKSVKDHANSLSASAPVLRPDGSFEIAVYFRDDLSRDSLTALPGSKYAKANGQTGEGIKNIVALFNNGYKARSQVYGTWVKHGINVSSMPERYPIHFLQHAIEDFNSHRSEDVLVYAELNKEYGGTL